MSTYCNRGLSMAAALAATALTASAALGSIDGTVLFNPYLFGSLGTLDVSSGTLNINTGTSTTAPTLSFGSASYTGYINNQNGMAEGAANGIPYVGVFDFSSINIGSGVTVNITGTNALALLSQSSANIAATLSVDASNATGDTGGAGGPGGFAGGNGGSNPANGQGPGGGGSNGSPGATYGNLDTALYGGSGGGGAGGGGNGGGGALDITAVGSLTVADINAIGGGGGDAMESGGGGSGGGIILSGSTVSDSANVFAYGMAGGHASLGAGGGGSFGGVGLSGTSNADGYNFGGEGGNGQILVQSTSANQSTSFATAGIFSAGGVTSEQIAQLEQPLLAPSNIDFGQVRTGTTAVQNLSFQNSSSTGTVTGQYTPALPSGMSGKAGTFSLAGGQSSTSAISFAPISRGTYSGTVSYSSNVVIGSVAISGTAVGPVFSTNVGTTPLTVINLGNTTPGLAATFDLKITNTSTNDVNGTNLANLTLESENITGPTANAFYVVPLTQNVLGNAAADSPLGNSTDLSIVFNPTTDGSFTDYLTITTDQGAPLGDVGQQFTYELTGTSSGTPTPEPATLALLALGGLALLVVRRRKHRV